MRFTVIRQLLCAVATVTLPHCGNLTSFTGGGVSETTNGFALGVIFNSDGSPAANTRVMLIPERYNPVIDSSVSVSMIDTTDSAGNYLLKASGAGRYNIEGASERNGDRILISTIVIRKNDTAIVTAGMLNKPGTIMIFLPDYFDRTYGYLYVPGTTLRARIEKETALIDSVPTGIIPGLRYAHAIDTTVNRAVKTHFAVGPGDTTVIADYSSWNCSKRLYLNTTAAGAEVSGTVVDFPLLIRLTGGNFTFSQAKTNGEDLRFAKSDSTPLAYEIEHWDSLSGSAEIWVAVDTIFGNNNSQSLIMFWGNPAATAVSNGAMTFDTASGASGVWHLNKTCNDATGHAYNGTRTATIDTTGVIGYCQRFNGSSFVKIPGLLGSPPELTLSAWVLVDTVHGTGGEVVSIGDAALIRMDDSWNIKGTHGAYCVNPAAGVDSTHRFTKSSLFFKQTGWHHLSYTVNAGNGIQRFYIDGSLCCFTESVIPVVYAGIGTDTYFGKHGNGRTGFSFSGLIDEVRICATARSQEWVRLCYANQRPGGTLVVFE